MLRCDYCGCTEDHPCVDGRSPTGFCFWIAKGNRPACSAHFTEIPSALVPKDPIEYETDESGSAPLLDIYTEKDMQTVVAMYEERERLLKAARRKVWGGLKPS